ncbi:AAA family ATPase [Paenibacillus sp. NPDC058071]|uniref:AAA family ATPase n=1 Tax=Paenibacillus sp. NPDC058071 TaxID=3346326 RepID=UPI0036D762E1
MRPLKITMTAFGPYRDAETIDFSELGDHRLFVISGSTGAGKTTIFDAICFALYGAASGEDRSEPRMLRSHFADDDTHTAVDFEFAVGRRTFRLFRQLPHRKGTNKSETGGKAELYETTSGGEEMAVDRFTVGDVNAKLETIIGLTKDQFNQIVMLPQGEFRKLLTSDTDNKEEILRRIFRTELYERLEGKFQQQTRELTDSLKEARIRTELYRNQAAESLPRREESDLAALLAQPGGSASQLSAGIAAEAAYYRELGAGAEADKAAREAELAAHEAELREALARQARFAELAAEQGKLAELESRRSEHEERERRLKLAERAALLAPYHEQAERAGRDAAQKQRLSEERQALAEAAQSAAAEAELRYRHEEEREEEREAARRELHRLIELAPAVEALAVLRQEAERLAEAEKLCLGQLAEAEARLAAAKEEKQTSAVQLKALETENALLPEMLDRLRRVEQQGRHVSKLLEYEAELGKHAELEAHQQRELGAMKQRHDQLERLWLEGQASLLAAHLHDGKPCPVCGSTEHPDKAEAAEAVPSREQLQQAKEQLARLESELQAAMLQSAAARAGRDGSLSELAEYGEVTENVPLSERQSTLRQEWKQLKGEVDRLEQGMRTAADMRKHAEELEERQEQLLLRKDKLQAELQVVAADSAAKRTVLEKELERIPEELRSPQLLEKRLADQRRLADSLAALWKEVQDALRQTTAKAAEERALSEQQKLHAAEAVALAKEAADRFKEQLVQARFESQQSYVEALLPESSMSALIEQIRAYTAQLAAAEKRVEDLNAALAGLQLPDLDALNEKTAGLKSRLEEAVLALQSALRLASEAERLGKALDEANAAERAIERKLGQVLDVYQMLKGDNALKISFERYILIEYLEQILAAANERLDRLSGGQFVLQRSDRLESRGKQSGLGLDIYDAYTGQNRDVKTLSGGEKFNASLCLALGMTDVIQSHQGGVQIEMMFIDEGFGSLDEDSLGKAIEALVDLQQAGRMIGVISHVQELKRAFPASLEVRKTKEGYSTTKIFVQ